MGYILRGCILWGIFSGGISSEGISSMGISHTLENYVLVKSLSLLLSSYLSIQKL
jgi:hypothetical protein